MTGVDRTGYIMTGVDRTGYIMTGVDRIAVVGECRLPYETAVV